MATSSFKNIGIFGTGDVGRVLGAGLLKKGYNVLIGSRDSNNEKVIIRPSFSLYKGDMIIYSPMIVLFAF